MRPPEEDYWRLGESTWIFGVVCAVIALVLLRLILRERLTLQGSMSYLAFLILLGGMALFPDVTGRVARALGFFSWANFFFATAIAALAILHLRALVTLSRIQLRSITLIQELAILQEKLERSLAAGASSSESPSKSSSESSSESPPAPPPRPAQDRPEPSADA